MLFIEFERHVDRLAAAHRTNIKPDTLESWYEEGFERFHEDDLATACRQLKFTERFPSLNQLRTATGVASRQAKLRTETQLYGNEERPEPSACGRLALAAFNKFHSAPAPASTKPRFDARRLKRMVIWASKRYGVTPTVPLTGDPIADKLAFEAWVAYRKKEDLAALGGLRHRRRRS